MSWFRLRVWGIVTWVTLSLFVPVWADDDTVVFAERQVARVGQGAA